MKTLQLLVLCVLTGLIVLAQDKSPIAKISQQLNSYFSYNLQEKVFIMTDKNTYKPGETIWFSAFVSGGNNLLESKESQELFVHLLDEKGVQQSKELFRLTGGTSTGDLYLPDDLKKGKYFLVAYSSANDSPQELSYTPIKVDPMYTNQWIAKTSLKDSISIAGQKNELYVVIRNANGELEKNTALKFQLMQGAEIITKDKIKTDEQGRATIPFTLPAKTNGELFVCELSDNRDEWKHQVLLPSNTDIIEVRFFPEGGSLINGIQAKIGFTAFNKAGIPVDIEGTLQNQDGKTISSIKTFTRGLGLFSLDNTPNQKYKLVIDTKTGQKQSFELPAHQSQGLALSVVKTDAEFISTNLVFADKQKHTVSLIINRSNNIYWAADLEIEGSGRIKIPTENLPQGINLLSVFTNEGQLLAERLVFTDKKQLLKFDIQPEKTSLYQGENMKVKVRLTDENNQPISGLVSVSVADQFRLEPNQPAINECLFTVSTPETPFCIVRDAFRERISNTALMDFYLIANRLDGFSWNEILNFKPETYQSSNTLTGISGVVTDKSGNKISKAKVSLVNNKNMQLHTTTTNSGGRFSFPNMNAANIDDYSAKATDQDGKRELTVSLNKNFDAQISEYVRRLAFQQQLFNTSKTIDPQYLGSNDFLFQKAPKVVKTNTVALDNQRRMLSTSTNLMDVIKSIKPYKIMNNQIVFIGTENSINYQGGALIVLDGQQMGTDISAISNISPMEVDHINVSTNPMDIQRYTGLNSVGVIEIFQKKAKTPEGEKTKGPERKYDGEYRLANPFEAASTNLKRDTRTTLLWIPEQKVDASGQFEFTVTGGRVVSDFIIEVQGVTNNGRLGSGRIMFSVVK
ncbi:MAG: carboxypeptidase regulatory-like domain-containing protein [Prolixibacteraceae bacterium]|nr:carboxypeptidase regulatory-like domain-containing protein [Prolixibacteraceae bacterium]